MTVHSKDEQDLQLISESCNLLLGKRQGQLAAFSRADRKFVAFVASITKQDLGTEVGTLITIRLKR